MTGFAPWTPRPRRRSIRTTPGAYAGTSRSSTPRERPPARCSPAAATARRGSGACSSRCAPMSASSSPRSAGAWTAWWPRGWCASSSARRRRRREARGAGQAIGFHEWGAYLRRGVRLGRRDGRRLVKKGTGARARSAQTKNETRGAAAAVPALRGRARRRGSSAGRRPRPLRRDAVEATRGHVSPARASAPCARLERAFGWRLRFSIRPRRTARSAGRRAPRRQPGRWTCSTPRAAAGSFLQARARRGFPRRAPPGGDDAAPSRGAPRRGRKRGRGREYRCDVCDRTVRGEAERRAHSGRRHLAARWRGERGARRARARFRGDARTVRVANRAGDSVAG